MMNLLISNTQDIQLGIIKQDYFQSFTCLTKIIMYMLNLKLGNQNSKEFHNHKTPLRKDISVGPSLRSNSKIRSSHMQAGGSLNKIVNLTNNQSKKVQYQATYVNLGPNDGRNISNGKNLLQFPSNNNNKQIKSRSCQNSRQKIRTIVKGNQYQTLFNTTSQNRSSTLRRAKKQLGEQPLYIYEYIGTQTNRAKKQKNFFYQGSNTQKFSELGFKSKQLTKQKSKDKMHAKNPYNDIKHAWNQSKVPFTSKQVLQKYSYYLSQFQIKQLKQYKNIYYIGHKSKSKIIRSNQSHNLQHKIIIEQPVFDNSQKQYIYEINDHIAFRYEILDKMGKGSYGEVLKVFDHKKKELSAIKVITNKPKFNQQAFVEIKILTHVKQNDTQKNSNIVKIKDFIIFRQHVCIVFEILSQNLYQLIVRNNYNGLNTDLIKRFAIQLLTGLQFMKNHNIIHCDLKPENILLRQYNKSGIKIIDMGSSCFKNQTKYTYIQSRYYRAPQITFGMKYNHQIDMWSTGCILAELYTGIPLFPGENQRQQMKYFVNTLGLPPKNIFDKGQRTDLFFALDGNPTEVVLNSKSITHFQKPLHQRITDSKFCQFIEGFLRWNPQQRFTPLQAINHQWIKSGLPPEITNILPAQNNDPKRKSARSSSRKLKTKSFEKEGHQSSKIRIKKSTQLLSRKSKQLQN